MRFLPLQNSLQWETLFFHILSFFTVFFLHFQLTSSAKHHLWSQRVSEKRTGKWESESWSCCKFYVVERDFFLHFMMFMMMMIATHWTTFSSYSQKNAKSRERERKSMHLSQVNCCDVNFLPIFMSKKIFVNFFSFLQLLRLFSSPTSIIIYERWWVFRWKERKLSSNIKRQLTLFLYVSKHVDHPSFLLCVSWDGKVFKKSSFSHPSMKTNENEN